jgi:hypothetical protein
VEVVATEIAIHGKEIAIVADATKNFRYNFLKHRS